MRTLLRNTRTRLYFQGPDRWTDDPEHSYDFRFTERALQYVATWDLTEVELAFVFEDAQQVTASALAPPPSAVRIGIRNQSRLIGMDD